jgi:SnoaL-like protein
MARVTHLGSSPTLSGIGPSVAGRPTGRGTGNAAVIGKLYERFNARDEDGVLALYSRCAEVHSFVAAVDGSNRQVGRDGIQHWYRNLVATLGMTIDAGVLVGYRAYVLSIPTIHVSVGGHRQAYECGIIYELSGGRIERSFGYGKVGSAMKKLGGLLLGEHELAV